MPPYSANVAVKTKSKAVPIIIISVAAAAVIAFLIVLFTVIIPNNSGLNGKIRHKWIQESSGVNVIWDYKDSVIYPESMDSMRIPFKWELNGDKVTLDASMFGIDAKTEFTVSFSSDGKTMTLKEDNGYSTETFKRAD